METAGWINKETAALGRPELPASRRRMRRPGKRGRARTSVPPARREASGGDRPPEGRGLRGGGQGEGEGDPGLPGSAAVCSGPEGRREAPAGPASPEAWGKPQLRVQKDGLVRFRHSEGLNLGIRGRWKAWASLGWDTPAPKPCPHTLRRRIGKMGKDGNGLTCVGPLHSCTGSLHSPARRRPLPLEADLRILQPPPSTHKLHLTHCGVTDALRPNLLLGKC